MSTIGRLFGLAAFTLAVVTVSDAAADDKSSPATGATFSSLPAGRIAGPPKTKAPAAIGAGEKLPGFFLAAYKGRGDSITLVPTAKQAKTISEGSGWRNEEPSNDACFTEDQPGSRFGVQGRGAAADEPDPVWRPNLQPTLTMSSSFRGQRPTVTAVHSERVVEESGKATLEVVDAWVDPNTRGVRLINKSSVPLELVSVMISGTKLYAARDAQSVHVILLMSRERKRQSHEGLFVTADNAVFQSSCDHIRATLKTEKGQGQTASFVANVELPSLEPKDPAKEQGEGKLEKLGRVPTEARVRPMHVHASVTWSSREKEPLLSASAGWDSRERSGFVF